MTTTTTTLDLDTTTDHAGLELEWPLPCEAGTTDDDYDTGMIYRVRNVGRVDVYVHWDSGVCTWMPLGLVTML
jgi:hypothetical protein